MPVIYTFGPLEDPKRFRLDECRSLTAGTQPVKIDATALKILHSLVRRAGRVATNRELADEARGIGHAIDEGSFAKTYIRVLRKALQDSPPFIAIVTNRNIGYKFGWEVQVEAERDLVPLSTPMMVQYDSLRNAPPGDQPGHGFRSNIASRGNLPFVGREDLIALITNCFSNSNAEAVAVLHGHPGVGKSELGREFARLNRSRYSGGTFWVDASTDDIDVHLAGIGRNILNLDFPRDLPLNAQGMRTFHSLGASPTLLIYDNVIDSASLARWLPPSGMRCHVLITMLEEAVSSAWTAIKVEPLSPERSLELVKKLAGNEFAEHFGPAIVSRAGGLPVQLVPDVISMVHQKSRGRDHGSRSDIAGPAMSSFDSAYERLGQPIRLVLHAAAILNPQSIPPSELSQHLTTGLGWTDTEFQQALDDCLDLHLLEGLPVLRMHQLFAVFLQQKEDVLEAPVLARIRVAQWTRFAELGSAVEGDPADPQTVAAFISYPLTLDIWSALREAPTLEEVITVASALEEIGRFEEACAWFQRVVVEMEKVDKNGCPDYPNLGRNLNQVGHCLQRLGKYDEAWPWFERAVAEKDRGDVDGRIDHESVSRSLKQMGNCLSRTGKHEEAWPWFERAVAKGQKGDANGRVDHESVGRALHLSGECLSCMGKQSDAWALCIRAVEEKEKGDVYGRIDHESVGHSLHLGAQCLWLMGKHSEAWTWFTRAVTEKEKGNVYGRIDHESVGRSLHLVGEFLSRLDKHSEAWAWFARAAAEKQRGDVYGRIDHESVNLSTAAQSKPMAG